MLRQFKAVQVDSQINLGIEKVIGKGTRKEKF